MSFLLDDDGEPGTKGKPILGPSSADPTNVTVIVTRYFGVENWE